MLDSTSPIHQDPPPEAPQLKIPTPVLEVVQALSELGGGAWLVGEGLSDALCDRRPGAYQICAATPIESWLARFPRAVPTRPAEGLVMIPTASGPVDVSAPREGNHVLGDLARRCFTIHAIAWNPVSGEWLDPFGGLADVRAKRLRTVGDPASRLAQDPSRALRVARLAGQLGYRVDTALREVLGKTLRPLTPALRLQVRRELMPLLLSPAAGSGIELLRSSGIEALLVPEARGDSGTVIEQLPPVLALRLAAWLRGTNAAQVLARLRIGRELAIRVQRLLRHHPIDTCHTSPERALRQLDDDDVAALFALRRAELDAARTRSEQPAHRPALLSPAELDRLEEKVLAARSAAAAAREAGPLALGGAQIMQLLGCGPGPQVGRALAFLASCVAENPECNTRDGLRERLESWAQASPPANPAAEKNAKKKSGASAAW